MQVCRICLSHNIHQKHASFSVVIIISVKYKNISNPNNLSKCTMTTCGYEEGTKYFYTITEYQFIYN